MLDPFELDQTIKTILKENKSKLKEQELVLASYLKWFKNKSGITNHIKTLNALKEGLRAL